MVALISLIPPGLWYCLWLIIFQWLPFSLSNPNSPRFTGQETKAGIMPTSKYIYPNYTSWNWGVNYRMSSGTPWAHCEVRFAQNSMNHLASLKPLLELEGHNVSWDLPASVNSEPVSKRPWKFSLFPFRQHRITLVRGVGPSGGMTGERVNSNTLWHFIKFLPQGSPAIPSFKGSGSANWPKSGNCFIDWDSLSS